VDKLKNLPSINKTFDEEKAEKSLKQDLERKLKKISLSSPNQMPAPLLCFSDMRAKLKNRARIVRIIQLRINNS